MKFLRQNQTNLGFSILETSISLSIIAMLVATVVAGNNLKHRLDINTIIEDIGNISTAYKSFQAAHFAIPGDILTAEDLYGAANTDNGNGDNDLDAAEELLFWQHLSLAGLIEGTYDGSTDSTASRMSGPLRKSIYDAKKAAAGLLYINISRYTTSTPSGGYGIISTKDGHYIDSKYDDGNPSTGNITAADGTGETAEDCVNTTANPDEYKLSNDSEEPCIMNFFIEQQ